MENNNPLFMPMGSIRGLAFLSIITTICYLSIIKAVIPELLADIALVTISFYFGSKKNERGKDGS